MQITSLGVKSNLYFFHCSFFTFHLRFQFSYYRLVTSSCLAELHVYLCAKWQEAIHARTELDEAQMLVNIAILTFLGIGYYTACHSTGNLTTEYIYTIIRGDDSVSHLVLFTCLRKPRLVESTILMMYEFYLAINREPVGMHVEKAHEDTYHDTTLMEILVLVNFLNHNDATISRSNNDIFRVILSEIADRTTEEVYNDTIYCREDNSKAIKWNVGLERTPQYDTDCNNEH